MTDAPYPRADPSNAEYLPADVWDAAQLPVGVRLEMVGNARTIRVWYTTTTASLGYRGESAGCMFVAYRAGQKVGASEAVMGEGMADIVLSGRPDLPVTVYLPEGMRPLVTGVAGVDAPMTPAPLQPRWLAYGDAVTQGWLASSPPMAWPAVAGRKLGLDVCNLGYAGTARGESTSALLLAETPAEVVSIAFGLNNWSRVPHTMGLMAEEVRCFLSVVREGHPDVPVVVVSPTARPDAEETPNRVGATLAELRVAMEETVLDCIGEGDENLYLVEGLSAVGAEDLEDAMYPGDEGHRRLAAAVAKILVPHLSDVQRAAEKRWAAEGTASTPLPVGSPPPALVRPDDSDGPGTDGAAAAGVAMTPRRAGRRSGGDRGDRRPGPVDLDDLDLDAMDRTSLNNILFEAMTAPAPEHDDVPAIGPGDEAAVDPVPGDNAARDPAVVDDDRIDETVAAANATAAISVTASPADDGGIDPASAGAGPPAAGSRPTARPVDAATVDFEIADMVVAALSLATNGADDVFGPLDVDIDDEPPPSHTYELQWSPGVDADPLTVDGLPWTDPAPEPGFWEGPASDDGSPWAIDAPFGDETGDDAMATAEVAWDESFPGDELQWTDRTPDPM
ncbi:MAG: SGNH/GDSL hydrolase family protein, partial [Acidimicrobiales bacterium]